MVEINFFELVIAYSIGLLLLYVVAFFFKVKEKTLIILTINSAAGAILFFIFSLFLPLAPSNGNLFLCGFAGVAAFLLIFFVNL